MKKTLLLLGISVAVISLTRQRAAAENTPPGKAQKTVWIDTDIAIGEKRPEGGGYADVDDAFALLQIINAPSLRIAGLSTVFGNTTLPKATKIAKKIGRRFSANDLPVYTGSSTALNLQNVQSNEAVKALAAALKTQKITIMAIGPATNIAKLILLHPDVLENIEEIILVAGRRSAQYHFHIGDNALPFPDLNFELDPVAFQVILQTNIPLTLCPFEISSKVWITEQDLGQMAQAGKASRYLAKNSVPWLQNWYEFGSHGFNPFDALASHYLRHPRQVQSKMLQAHLAYHPDDTQPAAANATPVFKPYLICNSFYGRPVRYCYAPAKNLKAQLLEDLNPKKK